MTLEEELVASAVLARNGCTSGQLDIIRTALSAYTPRLSKGSFRGLNRGNLDALYNDAKLSQWQIADLLGVTQGAVFCWMKKWGIEARSHDDSLIVLGKSGRFTGPHNPRWTGGRHISPGGYVMIRMPNHPKAETRGYVREHVLVWESAHGPVPNKWHIHHKNGDKTDNRIENLEALAPKAHRDIIPGLLRRIATLEVEVVRLNEQLANRA